MGRVTRVLLRVIAAATVLIVIAYVGWNLAAMAQARHTKNQLSDALTERIAAELPAAQKRAQDATAEVGKQPTHTWTAQHCEFATNDAGWTVQNHTQRCTLEVVSVWPAADVDGAFDLARGLLPPRTEPVRSGACATTTLPRAGAAYVGERRSGLDVEFVGPGDSAARWCDPTAPKRRAVTGSIPTLSPEQGWAVITDVTTLTDSDIGCSHWSIIFCGNPFGDEPAWGRAPR